MTSLSHGVSRTTAALRGLLLLATFLMMLASAPLWTNARPFPPLPIAPWFPVLPAPWDLIAFSVLLLFLAGAVGAYRPAVQCFLVGSVFLVLGDQSRLQPWFYMYWVMLLFTLTSEATAMTACRLALSAVYVWSGVQKFNPEFFKVVVPWLARPAEGWLPGGATAGVHLALQATPVLEIALGLGFWFAWTRRPAIGLCVLVHVGALLLLGPLGHRHNWIVWPWNLVMPGLAFVLFREPPAPQFRLGWRARPWAAAVVTLFSVLPVLSYAGLWDSYLSFSLYTGHLTKADVFITAAIREKLPAAVLEFVVSTPEPYNRELQGPYVVLVELWSDKILKVPPLPEGRNYRNIARYLAGLASDPREVRLVLIPRVGKSLFYSGADLRRSAGIPLDP